MLQKNELVGVCMICRLGIFRGVKFTRRVVDGCDFYIHDVCLVCPCGDLKDVVLMNHSRVLRKFREDSRVYLYIFHRGCRNVYGCFECDVCRLDMGWSRIRLNTSGFMMHDKCISRLACGYCRRRFKNAGVEVILDNRGKYVHLSCWLKKRGGVCLICSEHVDWKKFNMLPISIYQRYKIHVSCFAGGWCGSWDLDGKKLHWLTLAWYIDGDCLLSILPREIFSYLISFVLGRRLRLHRIC
jgi:hypothetical protein